MPDQRVHDPRSSVLPEVVDAAGSDEIELLHTLPGLAYRSPEWFERETEAIFHREWFLVGRAEALEAPGDYVHVDVAGERLLVVRTRTGDLRAFHDVCRHRGSRLVLDAPPVGEDAGAAHGRFKGAIRCPYHAWTYGLDGELRVAPFLTESDGLRKEGLSLHGAAVDTWGGFVFVNLSRTPAAPLMERLGDIPRRTHNHPLADLRVARRIAYDVAANWKVVVENYNECYHCGPVHPELCEVVPAFKDGGRELDWDAGVPHRDGATTFTRDGTTTRAPFPGLSEDERTRHKGELLYPNMMLSLSSDHVAAFTLWPLAPGRTRIDCDLLFLPDEIARHGFDPSDAVEFWDLVNRQDWRICEAVQDGMGSTVFDTGFYAPMEDLSLDIRRYVADLLGDTSVDGSPRTRPSAGKGSRPSR
jgi:phenylpropionate dioxygenase-like ring-hydroxylating dioxygenase large terminal subunit